jgi:cytoskeleton protein RodZ
MKDISPETPAVAPDEDAAESAGQFLKQERQRQNKTLKEVARATCIHINTIEALEENRRNKLPAEVFVRGFISIYAQYLGLPPQEVLDRYGRQKLDRYGRQKADEWVRPGSDHGKGRVHQPKEDPKPSGRRLLVVFALAVLALLIFLGYRQAQQFIVQPPANENLLPPSASPAAEAKVESRSAEFPPEPTPEKMAQPEEEETPPLVEKEASVANPPPTEAADQETAPQVPEASQAPEASLPRSAERKASFPAAIPPASTPAAADNGTPAAAPAHDSAYVLEAKFTETTWLKISLDGRKPTEYLFQPGGHHTWKADTIDLFLGNAGGVDLVLNGKPQPSPGPSGKTARLKFAAGGT